MPQLLCYRERNIFLHPVLDDGLIPGFRVPYLVSRENNTFATGNLESEALASPHSTHLKTCSSRKLGSYPKSHPPPPLIKKFCRLRSLHHTYHFMSTLPPDYSAPIINCFHEVAGHHLRKSVFDVIRDCFSITNGKVRDADYLLSRSRALIRQYYDSIPPQDQQAIAAELDE